MLDRIGDEIARATTIVEYQPYSKFAHHVHGGGEEFLVLRGTFHDEYGAYPAGTYVRNPIGTFHTPWVEDDGCTILVKLWQMTEPLLSSDPATGITTSMYVFGCDKVDPSDSPVLDSALALSPTIRELFDFPQTKELVQMMYCHPCELIPVDDIGASGGEELFIYSGSLVLALEDIYDNDTAENNALTTTPKVLSYHEWSWLRFPPLLKDKSKTTSWTSATATTSSHERRTVSSLNPEVITKYRSALQAGPNGAILWRKTSHLSAMALSREKFFTAV
jgi:hypothetical protein